MRNGPQESLRAVALSAGFSMSQSPIPGAIRPSVSAPINPLGCFQERRPDPQGTRNFGGHKPSAPYHHERDRGEYEQEHEQSDDSQELAPVVQRSDLVKRLGVGLPEDEYQEGPKKPARPDKA